MFGFSSFSRFPFSTITVTINPNPPAPGLTGGDDAPWTKEELKRLKSIQKKLRLAEEKRILALRADQEARKQTIADLVDPKPVAKKLYEISLNLYKI